MKTRKILGQAHFNLCVHTLLLASLACTNVSANTVSNSNAGFGSPDAVDNRIAEDEKNRDQATKDKLAEKGIKLAVDYSSVALAASEVVDGADSSAGSGMLRFYGSWDVVNKGGQNNGGFVWKVEHRHSYTNTSVKNFEFGAGGLGLVTPPFSDEGTRFTNLYWRQSFNNKKATVFAGFLDSTDYFDVYALASPWTGFMNFAFSTGVTTAALPGDAAFGIAGGTMLSENTFIIGGLTDMESDPTQMHKSVDTFFNDKHYFKSIELGWTSSKEKIYVDNVHLSLWHADESIQQGTSDGQGMIFSASKMIGKWLPFFRAGYSDGAGTLTEKSFSTGFGYYGLGGESNNLGAAINWADVVEDASNPSPKDQITLEVFYLVKAVPFFEITPDIQIIKNPALNPEKNQTLILGLRGRLIW